MTNYPTAWQRRLLWTVITYLAIVAGGAVAVWLIVLFGEAVGFMQPVLIPFALAAVLAFLLDPIVRMITSHTRLSRMWAVLLVFAFITLLLALLGVAVLPRIYDSTVKMVQGMPVYTEQAQRRVTHLIDDTQKRLARFENLIPVAGPPKVEPRPEAGSSPVPAPSADGSKPDASSPSPPAPSPAAGDGSAPSGDTPSASPAAASSPAANPPAASPPASPAAATSPATAGSPATSKAAPGGGSSGAPAPAAQPAAGNSPAPAAQPAAGNSPASGTSDASSLLRPNGIRDYLTKQIPALEARVPALLDSLLHLAIKSLGAAGVLLDLIIIPVYLYFLLVESRNIARHWNEYLPIRDSPFKKEVVSVLLEINGYLVAFFRGQLIVSTIDGILIGGSLALFVHLDFAFIIGLLVVVLTFIPYLGIILCYVPAILVAIIQYGDFQHPMEVIVIMFVAQTLESTIISPKIVGDSVGLHPLTVILSVFGWSLLLNGPIGAILAVPLSATVKVLLRRYVWEASGRGRHLMPLGGASVAALEDEAERAANATAGKRDADGPRIAGPPVAPGSDPSGPREKESAPTIPTPAPVAQSPPGAAGGASMPSAGIPTPPAVRPPAAEPTPRSRRRPRG